MQPSHRTASRRGLITAAAASAVAAPPLIRARARAAPIRIVAGPYRNVGGPAAKVAVELAVEDIGGRLLGRRLEVIR